MPVKGLKTITSARNGVGAFILQCKRLDFHYCNFGGSSRGMLNFLTKDLAAFAREHPQIEIRVSPDQRSTPLSRVITSMASRRLSVGEKLKRTKKPVTSLNESVRGIWSPYHGDLRGV
ncbi:54S ribosomal protein L51 [Penicillium citrinum]|uniref:54S ribosomal protein L51 n=1 Tax=Penicillium citrinum TaxID=5077 RepID=A0A9W9PEC5_PENCI|nr:54S ribosomal protein L51 [Penicillium citrinum]KAJ5243019.1 54S ribosomal protein L51 [Penicillium citrinum]